MGPFFLRPPGQAGSCDILGHQLKLLVDRITGRCAGVVGQRARVVACHAELAANLPLGLQLKAVGLLVLTVGVVGNSPRAKRGTEANRCAADVLYCLRYGTSKKGTAGIECVVRHHILDLGAEQRRPERVIAALPVHADLLAYQCLRTKRRVRHGDARTAEGTVHIVHAGRAKCLVCGTAQHQSITHVISRRQGRIQRALGDILDRSPGARCDQWRRHISKVGLLCKAIGALVGIVARTQAYFEWIDRREFELREQAGELLLARAVIGALHAKSRRQRRRRGAIALLRIRSGNNPEIQTQLQTGQQPARIAGINHGAALLAIVHGVIRTGILQNTAGLLRGRRRSGCRRTAEKHRRRIAASAVVFVKAHPLRPEIGLHAALFIDALCQAGLNVRAGLLVAAVLVAADLLVLFVVSHAHECAKIRPRLQESAEAKIIAGRRRSAAPGPECRAIVRRGIVVAVGLKAITRQGKTQRIRNNHILRRRPAHAVHAARRQLRFAVTSDGALGHNIDHAANGQIAPQTGAATANDFNALHGTQGNLEPLDCCKERVMHRNTIDQNQNLLVHAPELDIVPGGIGGVRRSARHQQSGHIAQDLIQTLRRGVPDFILSDDRGVQRHVLQAGLRTAGGHHDGAQRLVRGPVYLRPRHRGNNHQYNQCCQTTLQFHLH